VDVHGWRHRAVHVFGPHVADARVVHQIRDPGVDEEVPEEHDVQEHGVQPKGVDVVA